MNNLQCSTFSQSLAPSTNATADIYHDKCVQENSTQLMYTAGNSKRLDVTTRLGNEVRQTILLQPPPQHHNSKQSHVSCVQGIQCHKAAAHMRSAHMHTACKHAVHTGACVHAHRLLIAQEALLCAGNGYPAQEASSRNPH